MTNALPTDWQINAVPDFLMPKVVPNCWMIILVKTYRIVIVVPTDWMINASPNF